MTRYPITEDGGPLPFDLKSGDLFKLACCDCGLVHDVAVVIVAGRIGIAMRRNARATRRQAPRGPQARCKTPSGNRPMSLKTKPRKPIEARTSAAEEMLREQSGLMLSGGQVSRLTAAMRMEQGSWAEKAEAQTIVAQVKAELASGLTETVALEVARGGEVVELPSGAVLLSDRDGLFSLLRIKDPITAEQWDAGMVFRAGWELRSADVGSQLGAGEGGAGHDNDHYVKVRHDRAVKTNLMNKIRIRVAQECKDQPACLQMLQWVAGDGHSIRAFGGGRSFERNLAALKRALDVAGRRT